MGTFSPTRRPLLLRLSPQIILVNDASSADWWTEDFRAAITAIPKTRLINLEKRQGLIRAKIVGAHAATGDVLVRAGGHGGKYSTT